MRFFGFLKRNNTTGPDKRFLGRWKMIKSEGDIDAGEGVTMTFTEDGKLVYVIHQKESDQIMNLVYRVDGDRLVTNQLSSPQEEATRFSFDGEDNLILDYDGSKTWFARARK